MPRLRSLLPLVLLAALACAGCDTAYADATSAATRGSSLGATQATRSYGQTLSGILGSLLRVDFDLANGVSVISSAVDTLTDQKSGYVIAADAAGNRPTYTASDSSFLGKPTMTTAVTGSKALRSQADEGTAIFIASTRPYVAWVGKYGTQSGSTNDAPWSMGQAAQNNRLAIGWNLADGKIPVTVNGNGLGTGYTPDTNLHFYEVASDGTNWEIFVDGTSAYSNAGGAISHDVLKIGIGVRIDGARQTNATWARWWACTSAPSAAQRSAERSFAQQNYGTP